MEDFYTALILRSIIIALSNLVEKYKATNKEYIKHLTLSTLDTDALLPLKSIKQRFWRRSKPDINNLM